MRLWTAPSLTLDHDDDDEVFIYMCNHHQNEEEMTLKAQSTFAIHEHYLPIPFP